MRRIGAIWVLILWLAGCAHKQDPKIAIKTIIDNTYQANLKRDVAGATAYMADGYYLTRIDGERVPKSERVKALQQFFKDATTFHIDETSEVTVTSEKSAQSTIRYTLESSVLNNKVQIRRVSRSTEESWWELTDKGWKVIRSQVTSLEFKDPKGNWIHTPKSP